MACLPKSFQTWRELRDWTESSQWRSSPRSFQVRKTSTKATRTFTVTKGVTNTTYHIQDDKDPTIFKTVHRNHLVEYSPKEEIPLPMIEEYVLMDRAHDDFYERFMEQRIQKLNNSEHPARKDSLPFLIEPPRTAPITLPRKRVSKTSSDSGVNSPRVLSPEVPLNPNNKHPYLIPSTSRMNLLTGPLTQVNKSLLIAVNPRTRNTIEVNTIVSGPIILIQSLCFEHTLVKAIYYKFLSSIWFISLSTHMIFRSLEISSSLLRFQSFLSYSR